MYVKVIDMVFVENAERVINISQPKRWRGVKCDSCVFDVFHVDRSNYRKMQDLIRVLEIYFKKRVFVRKTISRFTRPEKAVLFTGSFRAVLFLFADSRRKN